MSISTQMTPTTNRPASFQLKGGLFPMNLLELKTDDIQQVYDELASKVSQSPAFFQGSPLVLGFEQLSDELQAGIDLKKLHDLCRGLGLVPSAVRGIINKHSQTAQTLGLSVLPKGRIKPAPAIDDEPSKEPDTIDQTQPAPEATKIITTPIRSGQQIYAPGADLIVLSSVSAGAEVLADGNIHIYGALRGRALAGVKGNTDARIFCSSQEAELVSVAGQFIVDENLRSNHWKQSTQIYLHDGNITIKTLA